MPGFPAFTTLQPIVGTDFHKSMPPPPPAGPLMAPHIVIWGSGLSQKTGFMWAIAATTRAASPESAAPKPTLIGSGHACGRTHDAGPHPGHIWPNALLPIILLGSSSKNEFGSGTVKVAIGPQAGGSADLATNMAYVLNPNLDCQDFPVPPAPTGLCFTTQYSVYANVTAWDFLRGLISMGADMLLTWVIGAACASLSALLTGAIGALLGRGAFGALAGAALKGSFSLGGEVNNVAIRSAAGLMNDGAGYFASNGRLFVNAWKFIPAAIATAWKDAPVDQAAGLAGTAVGTFVAGTPVGYAPKNAAISGWNPAPGHVSPAGKLGTLIDGLFR